MGILNEDEIIENYYDQIVKLLKEDNPLADLELKKITDALLRKNDVDIRVIAKGATFKRVRRYNEPNAVGRYSNPPDGPFKGFDESNSFVNTMGMEGRCNSEGTVILYVTSSEKCGIAEVKAPVDSFVSIANIKALQDLKMSFYRNHILFLVAKEI